MEQIQWSTPVKTKTGELVYTSLCNRFTIVKHRMATIRPFRLHAPDGKHYDCDSLREAKVTAQQV